MTLRFTPICFVCRFPEPLALTKYKDYLHVALSSTKRSPFQAFGTRGLARYHHLGIPTSPPLILNLSPSFPIHSPSQPLFLPPCASEPSIRKVFATRQMSCPETETEHTPFSPTELARMQWHGAGIVGFSLLLSSSRIRGSVAA